jgi:hypothetical protein
MHQNQLNQNYFPVSKGSSTIDFAGANSLWHAHFYPNHNHEMQQDRQSKNYNNLMLSVKV